MFIIVIGLYQIEHVSAAIRLFLKWIFGYFIPDIKSFVSAVGIIAKYSTAHIQSTNDEIIDDYLADMNKAGKSFFNNIIHAIDYILTSAKSAGIMLPRQTAKFGIIIYYIYLLYLVNYQVI